MSGLSLFAAFGIELEYMIVDGKRLSIRPIADRILVDRDGDPVADLEFGAIAWSNELVNHVIELKTNGPARSLAGLAAQFAENVSTANKRLAKFGARLMPTAMHPWMDPVREKQLWLGESSEIYDTFDRIFDCAGHGWVNLQSTHLNLPFAGDDQFGALHAATRLILPLLPALAASSPIHDGKQSPYQDSRLYHYVHHCDAIPSVVGPIIPEAVFTEADYHRNILEPMYEDLTQHDAHGVLKEEFLNARGAIARFTRGSLEIRLIDVQECPAADLAIAALVIGAIRLLVDETFLSRKEQQAFDTSRLQQILHQTTAQAADSLVTDADFLRHLGLSPAQAAAGSPAGEIWKHLFAKVCKQPNAFPDQLQEMCESILQAGPLSKRILTACHHDFSPTRLRSVYGRLCDCLAENRLFHAESVPN